MFVATSCLDRLKQSETRSIKVCEYRKIEELTLELITAMMEMNWCSGNGRVVAIAVDGSIYSDNAFNCKSSTFSFIS